MLIFVSMAFNGQNEFVNIEKFDIKLKSKPKDGIILQLHHTVKDSNGESRRIRFVAGAFSNGIDRMACNDNIGNIFILDLTEMKFWKLCSHVTCTCMQFSPYELNILLVGTSKKYNFDVIDAETGSVQMTLSGHSAPVKHISFSSSKSKNVLTASHIEAILWENSSYIKYFTLNTYVGAHIQQILFTPSDDYLVACFQNDTIQIWKQESMKSVKQIIPSDLKHIKSIAFTTNGRAMAIAGLSPLLILFCMDNWRALKSIDLSKYNIPGVHQISFVSQVFDGGSNKILAILSCDCSLSLFNLESLTVSYIIRPESSCIKKFSVSPTGKYLFCILGMGEINLYKAAYLLEKDESDKNNQQKTLTSNTSNIKTKKQVKSNNELKNFKEKINVCMDKERLRRILMQYGEYPEKFRSIIWAALLAIPKNNGAFSALTDKGVHSAYKDLENKFTIHSRTTLKNLKKLLSCLAHWCPLFGVVKFLPGFVFPFVKVLQRDPLLLFECVATILLNQCQLWFEYAPFPPISVLAIIENVLAESDKSLLEHYCEVGINSQHYALKLLETAFSEVLTCSEWLILWDHIVSNEPSFIIMAVVSYSIVQRNALKKIKIKSHLENFFCNQNPIDKKAFLKKTYVLLNETSEEIHPRRFISSFVPLEKGACYQQYTGYPKATICLKLAKNDRKKLKVNKYTLKELVTKSQEKIINEKCNKTNVSVESSKDSKGDTKLGDLHSVGVKEELIKSIIYQDSIGQHDSVESKKKTHSKLQEDCTRSINNNKNRNLEKEVEQLLHYSSSDGSY